MVGGFSAVGAKTLEVSGDRGMLCPSCKKKIDTRNKDQKMGRLLSTSSQQGSRMPIKRGMTKHSLIPCYWSPHFPATISVYPVLG